MTGNICLWGNWQIPGSGISDRFKLTSDTENVLCREVTVVSLQKSVLVLGYFNCLPSLGRKSCLMQNKFWKWFKWTWVSDLCQKTITTTSTSFFPDNKQVNKWFGTMHCMFSLYKVERKIKDFIWIKRNMYTFILSRNAVYYVSPMYQALCNYI